MYEIEYDHQLRETLNKLFKRDKKRYEICMKKIEEILASPEHYKPLRYDMKNRREVHIAKSFVLTFRIDGNIIRFLDLEHHDKIFRR
ncbi:MAG: type II toxin-antitoxin system mRNA interferase toxin, RelE/StbE family [Nanoarchaeota archaeon]|nr:type II toxin-antitoxin system YafQ family toxin [Nanoarchaeota archaeon]MBU4300155.1 type II toxin-antitoxin system YafQ family toxin [Nanoarchaeota archaeon]MBU4451826.1 type II toxin-antitoxin system YafQ family toxin [Nanoarchaeota archaeon]MCG2724361.1 type II toxin-antitoxin system YafQ family toxin [archaeon]